MTTSLDRNESLPGGQQGRAIQARLQAGNFYDAHQMATALINRNIAKGHHVLAIECCVAFGKEFIKHGQHALAAGLGLLMVKVFKEFELPVTDSAVNKILELFEPKPLIKNEDRYRLIERALKWAHDEDPVSKQLIQRLHNAAGRAYRDDGEFGLAQAHFLQTVNVQELAEMTKRWMKHTYPSEKELLVLRLVLTLLAQREALAASAFLQSPRYNFDSKQLPPPLQLAYLLPEACKLPDPQFFDAVKSKYSLVIRRDPCFGRLLSDIERDYFGPDLLNLLAGIFQA